MSSQPADANAQDHYYADADGRDADADAQSASSSAEQPVSKKLRIRLSALADDDVGLAKHSLLACDSRSAVRTDVGSTVFASAKQ